MTVLEQLVETVKTEDNTAYLKLLEAISANERKYNSSSLLRGMNTEEVAKLTDAQLKLLFGMAHRGGYNLHMHSYQAVKSPMEKRVNSMKANRIYNSIDNVPREDLKYLSPYHRNQWKKANPSTVRDSSSLAFDMDGFSLAIFKNTVKKGTNKTLAKNYILAINKAFDKVPSTLATIKMRNKFYYVVLKNTSVHTQTMLSHLYTTSTEITDGEFYPLEEDEVLALKTDKRNSCYVTSASLEEFSTDKPIVTHCKTINDDRWPRRMLSNASALTSIYTDTGNEAYLKAAQSMVLAVPTRYRDVALQQAKALEAFKTLL